MTTNYILGFILILQWLFIGLELALLSAKSDFKALYFNADEKMKEKLDSLINEYSKKALGCCGIVFVLMIIALCIQ